MNCKCGGKLVNNKCEWCGWVYAFGRKVEPKEKIIDRTIGDKCLLHIKEILSKKLGKPIDELFSSDIGVK